MGALFSGRSVSGYNANPPPDDGSTGSLNQVQWNRDMKGKIGDPLNTFATGISSDLVTAFTKTLAGGSVVKTAVNYGASAADQGRNIVATASGITVTTPDATSVLSPFVWAINNQSSGTITLAGFSAQTIDGNTTSVLGATRGVILWTDGSNWFSSGLVMGNLPTVNPPFGFDAPLNLQLNATVGSNLLTVAVKANNGSDPTASNPVLIPFQSTTGVPNWAAITSALSINTNATGATLGTANGVAFRLWIVAFNNAGTVVLALWQSVTGGSTPTAIAPLNEGLTASTTGISAAATSAGVFYTPNGTNLSNKSFRIIGYLEYGAGGLATAGTYSSSPTLVQLFGPGIKKPGDILQTSMSTQTSASSTGSTTFIASSAQISISPISAINLIVVTANGLVSNNTDSDGTFTSLSRGTTNNTGIFGNFSGGSSGATNGFMSFSHNAWDAPGTTSSTTYCVQFKAGAGSASFSNNINMSAQEIQV